MVLTFLERYSNASALLVEEERFDVGVGGNGLEVALHIPEQPLDVPISTTRLARFVLVMNYSRSVDGVYSSFIILV